jgi:hypothetical protein
MTDKVDEPIIELIPSAEKIRPSHDGTGNSRGPLNKEIASTGAPTPEIKLSSKKKRLIRIVKGAAGLKSKTQPFLPANSLSVVERYFHHMPAKSAQVYA